MGDKIKLSQVDSMGYGKIPKLVMKDKDLDVVAKAFYAYLCSYAGQGDSAFPKVETICHDLGISDKRFFKYRKALVEKGYIDIELVKVDGKWAHNVYTINSFITPKEYKPNRQIVYGQNGSTQNGSTQNVGTNNNSINNNSTNNNSTNIKDNVTIVPSASKVKYEDEIKIVVDHYNQSMGTRKGYTEKTLVKDLTKIFKEGYTTDNVKDVLNYKIHEWINNKEMRKNLVPGTLFRFSNFEKYLDQVMLANQQSNAYEQKKYQQPTQQVTSKDSSSFAVQDWGSVTFNK